MLNTFERSRTILIVRNGPIWSRPIAISRYSIFTNTLMQFNASYSLVLSSIFCLGVLHTAKLSAKLKIILAISSDLETWISCTVFVFKRLGVYVMCQFCFYFPRQLYVNKQKFKVEIVCYSKRKLLHMKSDDGCLHKFNKKIK